MENNKVTLKILSSVEELDPNYFPTFRFIETSKSGNRMKRDFINVNGKILQVCYCIFDKSLINELEPNMNFFEIYKYFSQMMKPVFKQLSETCGYTFTEFTEVEINPVLTKFINYQISIQLTIK